MIKEIFKIEGQESDVPYHLLITRENKGKQAGEKEDTEEVSVSMMLTQEQIARFIEHLSDKLSKGDDVIGFSINFEVKTMPDPDGGLQLFTENLRDRL